MAHRVPTSVFTTSDRFVYRCQRCPFTNKKRAVFMREHHVQLTLQASNSLSHLCSVLTRAGLPTGLNATSNAKLMLNDDLYYFQVRYHHFPHNNKLKLAAHSLPVSLMALIMSSCVRRTRLCPQCRH